MKLKTADIAPAIRSLLPITQRRTTLPILNFFRIESDGKTLTVLASDTNQWCERRVPCSGKFSAICVPARYFTEVCDVKSETVEVTVDGEKLKVFGSGTTVLPTLPAAEFPPFPADKLAAIGLNSEDVASLIESVEWAARSVASSDPDSFWKNWVNVVTTDSMMTAYSAAGHTIVRSFNPAICAPSNFVVERDYIPQLCECLNADGSELLLSPKFVGAESDNMRWVGRQLEEPWRTKQVEGLLATELKEVGKIDAAAILPHLETCRTFIQSIWEPVFFQFGATGAHLFFGGERGIPVHESDFAGKFVESQIAVNSDYLVTAFKNMDIEHPVTLFVGDRMMKLSDGKLDVLIGLVNWVPAAYKPKS